jgi:hypothetical protein
MIKTSLLMLILGLAVGSSITGVFAVTNFDNLLIDNGSGTSEVAIKSSTGNARFVLEDVGTAKYSVTVRDGEGSMQIRDNVAMQSRMLIASTGNVGIGTDTPTEKLDVNGNIMLSGVAPKIKSAGDICIGAC